MSCRLFSSLDTLVLRVGAWDLGGGAASASCRVRAWVGALGALPDPLGLWCGGWRGRGEMEPVWGE